MDAAAWTAIVGPITTLLGGLGGYMLAGRNEDARDRRAAARDSAARQAQLAERLEEQRHGIQMETLLRLQDELLQLARNVTMALSQDAKNLTASGAYLPIGELGEETRRTTASVQLLCTRLLDGELRDAVNKYLGICSMVALPTPARPIEDMLAEIRKRQQQVLDKYAVLNEQVGEHLRRELDRRDLAVIPPSGGQA